MRWFALVALLPVAACVSREQFTPRRSVSAAIGQAIVERPTEPIVLERATDFPWERVYIFGPYTTSTVVQDSVGRSCCEGAERLLESADDHDLLVFVAAGKEPVVERHQRNRGDFAPSALGWGIPRARAVFRVDTSRADGWRVLHLTNAQ